MDIAEALLPLLHDKYVETWITDEAKEGRELTLEHFDEREKRWHERGGEKRLKRDVKGLMAIHFQTFSLEWTLVEEDGVEAKRLVPTPLAAGVMSNYDFVSKIVQILRSMLRVESGYSASKLNDSERPHLVHYNCGTTLDATPFRDDAGVWRAPPFDQQIRQGTPQDRNSKRTGCVWRDADPEQSKLIDEICASFVEACEVWGQFSVEEPQAPDDIRDLLDQNSVESVAKADWAAPLRAKLEAAEGRCKVLDLLRGSHSDWDCVLYELLYWTCGVMGVKRYEEFLFMYGRSGANAKGSRVMLLRQAFGISHSSGYISFQNSLYFTQSEKEANKPDESASAARGCRLMICDDAGKNTTTDGNAKLAFNAPLTKKWTDIAGTPLPFQAKFGKQETMTVTWKMIFFGNVLPDFVNADQAFKRRPSLLELSRRFVNEDEYDSTDKTQVIANTDYKDADYLRTMVPELMHWMKRLLPALYTKTAAHRLKIQPVPAAVRGLTGEELATEGHEKDMAVLSELVKEFLKTCTRAAPVAGRGKSVEKFALANTTTVKMAFSKWSGSKGSKFGALL